ncbi:MAG: sensor domain-containing diguanylate cyclase [Herbinix sp.]|nr:sensor domain-containing diguanylate cyclase [Herbinix sp.]
MDEINKQQLNQLLQTAPGGIAKLAFDDMLTILYATDTFYSLIKNVSDKVITKAPLALLKIVYSADMIYVTQQLAAQKHREDGMININFRTLQYDGSFKWVMITGNKTQETYLFGMKTVPIYSCIAMDITNLMVNYKKLEQTNDYHNKILELSRDLYFEYEIATDTLSFSELFREIFGKDSVLPGFRKRLEKTKLIHPDELPAVISIYNSMMSGRKLARFELRLFSKVGVPTGYICYASMIFDENRNPYKVVGKLSTMNNATKEPEIQAYKPNLDSLTKVCSKESAELLIKEAAMKQQDNSLSALFVIDIRNYKSINEVRKSIKGENILTLIGEQLRNQFRTTDIVGRMGLNEFVVYMKDVQTDRNVYDKAEHLCKIIEAIYSYEHTKSGISTSIGITLQKGAQEYLTLLANANTALVMAKKVPTSSFEVFSGAIN